MKKVIVIGGGASGMIAAGRAAELGSKVILIEKNEKLGKKLYLTGKGRCNITNNSPVESLIENTPGNPYFLYSSFYGFDSQSVIDFFERMGVATKTERGNRVFPVSDRASDVVHALERYCYNNGVNIVLSSPVKDIKAENDVVEGVVCQNGEFYAGDTIIVATGGLSYPMTGSNGDGYRFAKDLGHKVTKLNPSLVPLRASEEWIPDLQGLSLRNVSITVKEGSKTLYKDFGEMLFTHYGVSGPVILSASRYLLGKYEKGCTITIDLKPALEEKELDGRILRDFGKYINKDFRNSLDDLLPQKLIPVIVYLSKIDPYKKTNEVTKQERMSLLNLLKNLVVTIKGTAGFNEAVITAGGVCVDEIDPGTMESKKIKGLYFAGEIIDVDAYTGGFNLQIAFSTGYTAGSNV